MRSAIGLLVSIALHFILVAGLAFSSGFSAVDWPGTARSTRQLIATLPSLDFFSAPDLNPNSNPSPKPGDTPSAGFAQSRQDASAPVAKPAADRFDDFGDWRFGCASMADGRPPVCSISQRLIDTASKTPLLVWQLVQDGNGGVVSLIRTPTGIAFDRGLVLVLTPGTEYPLPYSACLTGGCIARTDLSPEIRQAISIAEHIAVMVFSADGQSVRFAISTKGLAEGMSTLQR